MPVRKIELLMQSGRRTSDDASDRAGMNGEARSPGSLAGERNNAVREGERAGEKHGHAPLLPEDLFTEQEAVSPQQHFPGWQQEWSSAGFSLRRGSKGRVRPSDEPRKMPVRARREKVFLNACLNPGRWPTFALNTQICLYLYQA